MRKRFSLNRRLSGFSFSRSESRLAKKIRSPQLRLEPLEPRRVLAVIISEFQASNDTTVADEQGNYPDWIELHNTGTESVDLSGWHLTDDATDLTKWEFPAATLGADEYLLVFASARDSNVFTELSELHTNFKLASAGEYLALVEPDGATIASDFSPEFSVQLTDQSFGLASLRDTTQLVTSSSASAAFVPTDDSLGNTWTSVTFDDATWNQGTPGIGFEQLESGFSIVDDFSDTVLSSEWTVDIPSEGESTFEITETGLRVTLPSAQTTGNDRGLAPLFLRDVPDQNASYEIITEISAIDNSTLGGIAIYDEATGLPALRIELDRSSSFISQFRFTAGDREIDNDVIFNVDHALVRLQRDIHQDTWTASYRLNATDDWTFLESIREGSNALSQIKEPKLGLVAQNKRDVGSSAFPTNVEFASFELNVERERPLFSLSTGLDIESEMAGTNASAYIRIPFSAGEASQFDELDLAISYDDGFVAYLNGTEVARRNAPEVVSWNSESAEPGSSDAFGVSREVIGLTPYLDLLQTGENVLAFRGLNTSSSDSDFYISPELSAAEVTSTAPSVFVNPTPGTDNSLPAAPLPEFSIGGGTFTGTQVVEISLPTNSVGLEIRFTADGAEPTLESARYTGPIEISHSTLLRAKAFDPRPTSAYAPSNTAAVSYIKLDSALLSRDSDLPILIIDTLGEEFPSTNSPDLATSLVAAIEPDTTSGRTSLAGDSSYSGLGGLRTRGGSTGSNAKPSLKFETWGNTTNDFDVPLFGLPAESDWVLYAPFSFDRTLIHEPFIYSLSNDIGRYAPRTIPIEVYANTNDGIVDEGDYQGVYILIEKIKPGDDRVDIADADPQATYDPDRSVFDQPDPAITGGYLWEIDRPHPGVPQFSAGGGQINWRSPVAPTDPADINKVTVDQQAYATDYLNEFWSVLNDPNKEIAYDPINGYERYIDVESWIDHHLLNVVAANVNAQRLSAYFHKDVGGKLKFGPIWDFDRAFESTDGRDDDPTVWRSDSGDRGTDFFGESGNTMGGRWWRQLFDDPNFFQRYIDRYHELRQTTLSDSAIDARIDFWAGTVAESSERNLERWQASRPRSGACNGAGPGEESLCDGTWNGEIENMRAWLHRRLEFMDATFPVVPTVSIGETELAVLPDTQFVEMGATVTGTPEAGGTIYYTLDGTDPRGANGLPSAAALILDPDTGFEIEDSVTNVTLRNLDATDRGPESQLVTTDWSAPLQYTFVVTTGGIPGDLNGDGLTNVTDIDFLQAEIRRGNTSTALDFDSSGAVDQADVSVYVDSVFNTFLGDADLDGDVDASDLNVVGLNWLRTEGAGWSDGDFNGDGNVGAADLNLLGLNWREGTVQPTARTPRAPLAAIVAPNHEGGSVVRTLARTDSTVDASIQAIGEDSFASTNRQRVGQWNQFRRQSPFTSNLIPESPNAGLSDRPAVDVLDTLFAGI